MTVKELEHLFFVKFYIHFKPPLSRIFTPFRILKYMERNKKSCDNLVKCFQMPLHYPRYTKKDYQDMPETILDMLLAAYGLSPHGDLAYKRAFAMGAFLWTELDSHSSASPL